MKRKWLITIIIISVIMILGGFLSAFLYKDYQKQISKKEMIEKQIEEEAQILKAIYTNYNEIVITNKDAKIYQLKNSEYIEMGMISEHITLQLAQLDNITLDNQYLKLSNMDYYISYEDIRPSEKKDSNANYKHYVPFDEEIITKNPTNFYLNDKIAYSINESMKLPIIINDSSYYYVEFDNQLFAVRKDNVEKTVESKKNIEIATQIGVLNYHFFYDKTNQVCDEIICLEITKFEEQLQYLKDNDFYTATMEDMVLWMDKKIQLPKKTAVLTIDDGALGTNTHLIRLLEKYDLHGTLFLITAWWPKENYLSDNLEIQSHGYDIHYSYNGQARALTMSKEALLEDLKTSITKLDGENTAFCYPFYAHNATVRSAVMEAGFQIAFAGGNRKANQNNDHYQISRYVIYSYTTLESFKNMVN